jgi:hypothetical protein
LNVLQGVALATPPFVVQVLPSSCAVQADRLQVAICFRRDPYLHPGGRYREGLDALERRRVTYVPA